MMGSVTLKPVWVLRRSLWEHPEWWVLVIAGLCWLAMLLQQNHHGHHFTSYSDAMVGWSVMIVAMMFPLMTGTVRRIAYRSLPDRRHLSIILFLVGYLLPWLLLGFLGEYATGYVGLSSGIVAMFLFVLAGFWPYSRIHLNAVQRSHATRPIRIHGTKWIFSTFGEGGRVGSSCVTASFPMMLACAATNHHIVAMIFGFIAEYLLYSQRIPHRQMILITSISFAIWFGLLV